MSGGVAQNKRRPRLAGAVRLGVGVALLGLIFHVIFCNEAQLRLEQKGASWASLSHWEQRRLAWVVGPAALWETARGLDPADLLTALASCGLLVILGALRWRSVMLALGFQPRLGQVFHQAFVGQFFNAFLLGSAGGDVARAWYAAKAAPHRRAEAAMTVVVDRLLGTLALLAFAASFAAVNYRLVATYRRHLAVTALIAAMLVAAAALAGTALFSNHFQGGRRLARLLARVPKGGSLIRALAACRPLGANPRALAAIAGWSMLMNACVVAAFASLGRGIGVHLSLANWAYVSTAVVAVSALPITPAGLGVRENLFVWLLAVPALAVKPGVALSLSLLGYSANLAWSAVGGVVYLTAGRRHEPAAPGPSSNSLARTAGH